MRVRVWGRMTSSLPRGHDTRVGEAAPEPPPPVVIAARRLGRWVCRGGCGRATTGVAAECASVAGTARGWSISELSGTGVETAGCRAVSADVAEGVVHARRAALKTEVRGPMCRLDVAVTY